MKSVQGLKLDETTSKSGSGSRSRGLALMEFFCKLPHSASQFVRLYPMRCTYPVATFQRQEDIRGARMNFGDPTAATAPQWYLSFDGSSVLTSRLIAHGVAHGVSYRSYKKFLRVRDDWNNEFVASNLVEFYRRYDACYSSLPREKQMVGWVIWRLGQNSPGWWLHLGVRWLRQPAGSHHAKQPCHLWLVGIIDCDAI